MRQQADALVHAVSAFRLSIEDQGQGQAASRQPAPMLAQGQAAPAASSSTRVTSRKAASSVPATVGDDWEEF